MYVLIRKERALRVPDVSTGTRQLRLRGNGYLSFDVIFDKCSPSDQTSSSRSVEPVDGQTGIPYVVIIHRTPYSTRGSVLESVRGCQEVMQFVQRFCGG